MPDLVQDITMKTGTSEANPNHTHIFKNIAAQVIMILTEAVQGHNTGINVATTGAVHNNHAPPIEAKAIDLTMTHHIDCIAEHPHIDALQVTNQDHHRSCSQPSYQSSRQDSHRSSSHSSRS